MTNKTINKYLAKIGSKGGRKSSSNMTAEERTNRAKKAAAARWKRKEISPDILTLEKMLEHLKAFEELGEDFCKMNHCCTCLFKDKDDPNLCHLNTDIYWMKYTIQKKLHPDS